MTLTPKLFVLKPGEGRLFSINPDGTDKTFLVTGCPVPDGVAVDVESGHIYWTNMGVPSRNDGSIERADLDGTNRTRPSLRPVAPTLPERPASLRCRGPQAVLGRPRRHAGHALRSRRDQRRDPGAERRR